MSAEEITTFLIEQWNKTKNPNAFYFYMFLKENPSFLDLEIKRSEPSKRGFNLKKPLFERLVNKMMTDLKRDGGKKIKARNLLLGQLTKKSQELNCKVEELLCSLIVKTVPNYTVRRLKYGSGFLTKLVHLTIAKKISWFLKTFVLATRKRNKSFADSFSSEVDMILNKNTKSFFYVTKRESEVSAFRANLQ